MQPMGDSRSKSLDPGSLNPSDSYQWVGKTDNVPCTKMITLWWQNILSSTCPPICVVFERILAVHCIHPQTLSCPSHTGSHTNVLLWQETHHLHLGTSFLVLSWAFHLKMIFSLYLHYQHAILAWTIAVCQVGMGTETRYLIGLGAKL